MSEKARDVYLEATDGRPPWDREMTSRYDPCRWCKRVYNYGYRYSCYEHPKVCYQTASDIENVCDRCREELWG